MKKNNEKLEKILALLSFIVAAICAVFYDVFYEKVKLRNYFIAGFTVAFIVLTVILWRYMKRKKVIKHLFSPLLKKISAIYNKVAAKVKKFLPKKYNDNFFAKGKDEIKIKFAVFSSKKSGISTKNKIKMPRYSSLKTNKEKARFLYIAFLRQKITHGYHVDPTKTPNEIKTDFCENKDAQMIFEVYPTARYTPDDETIPEETLAYLEEKIKP